MTTKKCRLCFLVKSVDDFPKRNTSKDGLRNECRKCRRPLAAYYTRQWRKRHPKKAKESSDRCHEKRRAINRNLVSLWRKRNPKKVAAQKKRHREKHCDTISKRIKEWRQEHPERIAEYSARRRSVKRSRMVHSDAEAITEFYRYVRTEPRLRCYWCKSIVAKANRHVDRVIPLSKGGLHARSNLCCSCKKCNLSKHSKLPSEFTGQGGLW